MCQTAEKPIVNAFVGLVPSSKTSAHFYSIYKVRIGEWKCTCKKHQFTKRDKKGVKFPCHHLTKIWKVGQELKKEGVKSAFRDGCAVFDSSLF